MQFKFSCCSWTPGCCSPSGSMLGMQWVTESWVWKIGGGESNPPLCRNPHTLLGKRLPNFPLKNSTGGTAWSSEGQLSHCFRLLPPFSSSIRVWVSSCEASTWPAFGSHTRVRRYPSAFLRETLPPLSHLLFLNDQVPLCGISPPGPGRSLVALPACFPGSPHPLLYYGNQNQAEYPRWD